MTSEDLKTLGQKAFAAVIGVRPAEVNFLEDIRGEMLHQCYFENDDKVIVGTFNHWKQHDSDDGSVCIEKTEVIRNGLVVEQEFPFRSYRVSNINSDNPFVH